MKSAQLIQRETGVILLTTEAPNLMRVTECHGLVTGQAIMGANFIKDYFARIRDTIGGRVSGYETALQDATADALQQMAEAARDLGANVVLGVRVNTSSTNGRMLMASCIGTAVSAIEAGNAPATRHDNGQTAPPEETRQYLHSGLLG